MTAMTTINDLLGNVDLPQLYAGLLPEKRREVDRRAFEIGHDRGTCRDYGIDYARAKMQELWLAACYELGIIGRQ